MSANKPKQQEIGQKTGREEEDKDMRKGGQNPNQRGGQQAEDRHDTPNYRNPDGERKNG
jgi:hypothetical protein